MSTYAIGSDSSDSCVTCNNGVDSLTYACLKEQTLDNICWDQAQVLSLNNTPGVEDLYLLMYESDYGIQATLDNAIDLIQDAAESDSSVTLNDVRSYVDQLENAHINWINKTWANLPTCIQDTVSKIRTPDLENLVEYQFGSDSGTDSRFDWIAHWHCTGATFGCGGDLPVCPQASTCFSGLQGGIASLVTAPGGVTAFGYNPKASTGRFTPMYSPEFIKTELEANVNNLTQWETTRAIFQGYTDIMNEIQQTGYNEEKFTATAINATLQVTATTASVNLESSYTKGNLYYDQGVSNSQKTISAAGLVQTGPEVRVFVC